MTTFQLLSRDASGFWSEWRTEQASSGEAAIRAAYMKHPDKEIVTAVAVPARSWKPQQIRVERTERVVLGEPKLDTGPDSTGKGTA